jgi:hypothetical protein
MPAFDFPQYQESLLSKGICYGQSVADFDESYYVDNVGMSDGAAVEFVHSTKRLLHNRKKAKLAGKESRPRYEESFEV